MKSPILLLLVLTYAISGFSQYVVYGSKTSRQFGIGYNINGLAEDDGSAVSMDVLKGIAKEGCATPDCELIAQGNKEGWIAILKGANEKGQFVFITSDGNDSKPTAEQMVKEKYKKGGGAGEPMKISYFYVYTSNIALDKLMKVSDNKPFTISLPRNASTGYSWLVEITDENLSPDGATVEKVSEKYSNPSGGGAGRSVGGTGTSIFTFNIKAKGASIIKFFLVPPGVTESSKAIKTKIYKVMIL